MIPHLLRCQGNAVNDDSFTLGRIESAAPSAFSTSGFDKNLLQFETFLFKNQIFYAQSY